MEDSEQKIRKSIGRDNNRHHKEKDLLNINASPNKEEFTNKPISEVNLSNSEYCTPSYLLSDWSYSKSIEG